MTMNRRNLLAAGAATLACSLGQNLGAATGSDSLARLASAKGIRFGSTIGNANFADPAYRRLNAAQCRLIVPETEMKWIALRPDSRRFDFRAADAIVAWARQERLGVRGHTLLWHFERWMPEWTRTHDYGVKPGTEAARLLDEHVDTVARRYAVSIDSFDVVNEGIDPDTGLLRETVLSKPVGAENLIDMAFRSARRGAPQADGRRTPPRRSPPAAGEAEKARDARHGTRYPEPSRQQIQRGADRAGCARRDGVATIPRHGDGHGTRFAGHGTRRSRQPAAQRDRSARSRGGRAYSCLSRSDAILPAVQNDHVLGLERPVQLVAAAAAASRRPNQTPVAL